MELKNSVILNYSKMVSHKSLKICVSSKNIIKIGTAIVKINLATRLEKDSSKKSLWMFCFTDIKKSMTLPI